MSPHAEPSTEIAELRPPSEEATQSLIGGSYVSPSEWATMTAIAVTSAKTEFVPKGLQNRPAAIMAALLFGRDQGLAPSVALSSIYVVEGKPTMAGTLMVAKIREAGHRLQREELHDESGEFLGVRLTGIRKDTEETDTVAFTMTMAARAGLTGKDNWKKYPEMMAYWRCVSWLGRTLFADVFLGVPIYNPEEMESDDRNVDGAPRGDGGFADRPDLDFGPDEEIAARLAQLFAVANELVPGAYRPAKQATMLRECGSEEDRLTLISVLEDFIVENGGDVPEPVIEGLAVEEAEVEAEQVELPIEETEPEQQEEPDAEK